MEVPLSGVNHPWRGAQGLFLLGCLEPVRITLIAQQVRALNLVYALYCEGRLKQGSQLAIFGAGASGLTAASAAAHFGCKVTVFEQQDRPLRVFRPAGAENSRRYIHPNLDRWPEYGWRETCANLPVCTWTAGSPKEVADQIEDTLKGTAVELIVKARADLHPATAGKWRLNYSGASWDFRRRAIKAPPVKGNREFDAVVLAVGFGYDGKPDLVERYVHALGYWEDDIPEWRRIFAGKTTRPRVLISGDGDGALVEAACACTVNPGDRKSIGHEHRGLIEALGHWHPPSELQDEFLAIEDEIRQRTSMQIDLAQRYGELEKKFPAVFNQLDKILRLTAAKKPKVILATSGRRLLQPRTLAINRLLVWRCWRKDILCHRVGRLHSRGKNKWLHDDRADGIGGKDLITDVRQIIIRHGPGRALHAQYPAIAALCEEKIVPKNELDQTRIPFWPLGFFSGLSWAKAPGPAARWQVGSRTGTPDAPHNLLSFPPRHYAAISLVDLHVTTGFKPNQSQQAGMTYSKFQVQITFKDAGLEPLYLEHQVTPTLPFRLRLTERTSEELRRGSARIDPVTLHGDPAWAVGYKISGWDRGERVCYELEGNPCGFLALPDAVGFPIYSDMKVERLQLHVCFEDGLLPLVRDTRGKLGQVKSYLTSIRRHSYEDGETAAADEDLSTRENGKQIIPVTRKGATAEVKVAFDAVSLPSGFFCGIEWDALIPSGDWST